MKKEDFLVKKQIAPENIVLFHINGGVNVPVKLIASWKNT